MLLTISAGAAASETRAFAHLYLAGKLGRGMCGGADTYMKERSHHSVGVTSVVREYGPKVGETIPVFSALDQFGRPQTLATIAGPAGALIAFNRSADW